MHVVPVFYVIILLFAVIVPFAGAFWFSRRKMKRKKALLGDALSLSGCGVVLFDSKGRFVSANDLVCEFLPAFEEGFSEHTTLQDVLDYLFDHAVDCDAGLRIALDHLFDASKEKVFREVVQGRGDRPFLAEVHTKEGYGYILNVTDVSPIKRREDDILRLSQTNYQLYQAVEAAESGICVIALERGAPHIVFANNALCSMLNTDFSTLQQSGMAAVFDIVDAPDVCAEIEVALRGDEGGDFDVSFKGDAGNTLWFNFCITPVREEGGANPPELFVGIMTDITMLKLRDAEFFKGQKLEALGNMAAGVSHDFNNILSIVDGYARMISERLDDEYDEEKALLGRVRLAAQRGAGLVKQMLTFSRHKIAVEDVIDLGEVVKEQEALLLPLLDASIQFNILVDEQDMVIECPADHIAQILMNLSVNARDAMQGGGRLLVEVRRCLPSALPESIPEECRGQEFACLSISDTGDGMRAEVVERMFDPFFTTKAQGEGTGLGLSMVYGLVQQMEGYIDVCSSLGRGTTISIYLPLSDRELNRYVHGGVDDLEALKLKGYTALVCEDEADLLLLVSNMLEGLGMHVLQASNGHEALSVQDEHEGTIDILLTDVVMPELDGLSMSQLMNSLRPEMKTIFMSGYPADGQMARVSLPEGVSFLAKPVKYEFLARMVYQEIVQDGSEVGAAGEGGVPTPTVQWTENSRVS